jgi:hypothetical protein
MLFGLIKDKPPAQQPSPISCALCSTIVSQSCATAIGEPANSREPQRFACFRCFARIIVQRRQAKYSPENSHQRAA